MQILFPSGTYTLLHFIRTKDLFNVYTNRATITATSRLVYDTHITSLHLSAFLINILFLSKPCYAAAADKEPKAENQNYFQQKGVKIVIKRNVAAGLRDSTGVRLWARCLFTD